MHFKEELERDGREEWWERREIEKKERETARQRGRERESETERERERQAEMGLYKLQNCHPHLLLPVQQRMAARLKCQHALRKTTWFFFVLYDRLMYGFLVIWFLSLYLCLSISLLSLSLSLYFSLSPSPSLCLSLYITLSLSLSLSLLSLSPNFQRAMAIEDRTKERMSWQPMLEQDIYIKDLPRILI
jgi:hypothetical protein